MRKTFKNINLEEEFSENGYVIMDLWSPQQIQELTEFYHSLEGHPGRGFHASSHSSSLEYKQGITDKVNSVVTGKLNEILDNYRPLTASYTVKETDENSSFDFHLDWSMVDEDKGRSVSVWFPLVDLNEENGHLWILHGSHKLGKTFRGGPGLFLFVEGDGQNLKMKRFEKRVLNLRKGQSIIYDHRLFHGSPVNRSSQIRLAINHCQVPAELPSTHYHLADDGRIAAFEVSDKFYSEYVIGTEPSGQQLMDMLEIEGNFIDQSVVNDLIE